MSPTRSLLALTALAVAWLLAPRLAWAEDDGGGQAATLDGASAAASDFTTRGDDARLELVLDREAVRPTDLEVITGAGSLRCHLPCALDVPRGAIQLRGDYFDQSFALELPTARFRIRAGDPIPWAESFGGLFAGGVLTAVGVGVALTTTKESEVKGGIALAVLGGGIVTVLLVVIGIAAANEHGSLELDEAIEAARQGVLARF